MPEETMICPRCGAECDRDEVHNGIAMLYGPWGCPCGWSEDSRYDRINGEAAVQGDYPNHIIDQWGRGTPKGTSHGDF